MAVISFTELFSESGSLGEDNQFGVTRNFQTKFSTIAKAEEAMLASLGPDSIPKIADPHPTLAFTFVTNINATATANRMIWNVSVSYQTKVDDEATPTEHPVDQEPEIAWADVPRLVLAVKDINNKLIGSSAGEAFDPPLEVDNPLLQFTMNRNEKFREFKPGDARRFKNAVNSRVIYISGLRVEKRQGKVEEISGKTALFEGELYWQVSYRIVIEAEGRTWDKSLLDQGFKVLDESGNAITSFDQGNGSDEKKPFKLDGTGNRLPTGSPDVFTSFRIYPELPFSLLGLPR